MGKRGVRLFALFIHHINYIFSKKNIIPTLSLFVRLVVDGWC
jgi:hypothetical protein